MSSGAAPTCNEDDGRLKQIKVRLGLGIGMGFVAWTTSHSILVVRELGAERRVETISRSDLKMVYGAAGDG